MFIFYVCLLFLFLVLRRHRWLYLQQYYATIRDTPLLKYEQLCNLIAVSMRTKNIGIAGGVVRWWWWWLWVGKKQRRKKKPSQRQRKRNERSGKWELALWEVKERERSTKSWRKKKKDEKWQARWNDNCLPLPSRETLCQIGAVSHSRYKTSRVHESTLIQRRWP